MAYTIARFVPGDDRHAAPSGGGALDTQGILDDIRGRVAQLQARWQALGIDVLGVDVDDQGDVWLHISGAARVCPAAVREDIAELERDCRARHPWLGAVLCLHEA